MKLKLWLKRFIISSFSKRAIFWHKQFLFELQLSVFFLPPYIINQNNINRFWRYFCKYFQYICSETEMKQAVACFLRFVVFFARITELLRIRCLVRFSWFCLQSAEKLNSKFATSRDFFFPPTLEKWFF